MLVALLGGPRLAAWAGLPPAPLTVGQLPQQAGNGCVVVRGTVLDDSLNVPVPGTYVFVSGTKYGAVTDERGRFTLSMPAEWEPVREGQLMLDIHGHPFTLQGKTIGIKMGGRQVLPPLTIRLESVPGRGHIMGKVRVIEPPVPPPGPGQK